MRPRRTLLAIATALAFALSATPALAAPGPTGLTLTPGVEALRANWSASGEGIASWTIYDRPTGTTTYHLVVSKLPASTTSYTISPLAVQSWDVRVKARLVGGKAGGYEAAKGTPLAKEEGPGAGKLKYRLDASSYFDEYSKEEAWIKAHIAAILAYPTFGDVYTKYGRPVFGAHDAATEGRLSPLTKAHIKSYVAKDERDYGVGYAGPYMDDINWSVGYRDGSQSKTLEPEKHEEANLIEAVRSALPKATIEINSQYHDIWPLMKAKDADVERALTKVNLISKEFGVGPSAGISTAADYKEFVDEYVPALHAKDIHVTLEGDYNNNNVPTMEYNLATYFLLNDGHDYVSAVNQTPVNWWEGLTVNLGSASSGNERSSAGVWKRSFSGGVVYTVEPEASTQTIPLGKKMKSAEWGEVESVTLKARQGAVLVG